LCNKRAREREKERERENTAAKDKSSVAARLPLYPLEMKQYFKI